jgi:hypothetical protein
MWRRARTCKGGNTVACGSPAAKISAICVLEKSVKRGLHRVKGTTSACEALHRGSTMFRLQQNAEKVAFGSVEEDCGYAS